MKQIRIIKANDSALPSLYAEGWSLICISDDKMYLEKEIKRTREQKNAIKTQEYLEFRDKYPSKTWIYDDKLIIKYNKLVEEWLHKNIMDGIERYAKELEVTGKPICNASIFLNQKRWQEELKVVKNKEDEWMNALFTNLDAETIKLVKQKISDRRAEKKHVNEEVVRNIIEHYTSSIYRN